VVFSDKLDAKLIRAFRVGVPGTQALQKQLPSLPVVIELNAHVRAEHLAMLRGLGVQVDDAEGRPLTFNRFISAQVTATVAAKLDNLSEVRRVSFVGPRGPVPLDHSASLMALAAARGAAPAQDYLTGAGILIADMDTNVDLFHPTFFRADGGYFDWLDVDGDGVFTAGVDGVDRNHDAFIDPAEVAAWLPARTLYGFSTEEAPARPAHFDPGTDWLYLDENHNGERDYGAGAGYSDADLAFGEPLFVPDDVDQNGVLDLGERVIRLGTSKFRKVFIKLAYATSMRKTLVRGVDLATHQVNVTEGRTYGYADALHATGVLSIVAGDVPLVGRRWVGIAPDAELLLSWEDGLATAGTTWAVNEQAQVFLYEMCPWTGYVMDGSDVLSRIIDTAAEQQLITHTCPVGDQAGARKHASLAVPAAGIGALALDMVDLPGLYYVEVSLNLQGAGAVNAGATLVEPNGTRHEVGNDVVSLSTGAAVYPARESSDRGTRLIDLIFYSDDLSGAPIPTGGWSIEVHAPIAAATVDAFVSDNVSGFSQGVAWDAAIATDLSTLGIPSTADHCIAVAAHTGHPYTDIEIWWDPYPPGGSGEVRDYSPWGPRIDGVQKPDVAAPDNPFAAAPHDYPFGYGNTLVPHGAFWPFGGTSGAAPHVTGVAALLAQANVWGDAARDAMRAGAWVDEVTGAVPNERYGYGRLNAAGALGVTATGEPPTVTLQASATRVAPGTQVMLTATAVDPDGPAGALELRWDDGYDGSWDTTYAALAPHAVMMATAGKQGYKARVRDAAGRIAEAVVWVTYVDPIVEREADTGCGCRGAAGRGSLVWSLGFIGILAMRRRRADCHGNPGM